jgi:radical SAM superfamily enzyme YgiQ (UPF0313 family)
MNDSEQIMITRKTPAILELYHLYRRFSLINLAYPIVLDALKVWAEAIGWQVRTTVCKEDAVNIHTDAEIIGFSVYTQTANATYRVAEKLRAEGKIVILGGPHFRGPETFAEAAPYCDVLVSSICERQWKVLLSAISEGKIGPNRRRPLLVIDRERNFRYPKELFLNFKNKKWFQYPCIPVSLGCPYQCEFCSPYMGGDYILRDITTICKEVAQVDRKPIWLCDATFGLNKQHTLRLMKALAPLKKTIVVETSVARMNDSEFIQNLAIGGVKWVTVGVETLSAKLKKHGAGTLTDNLTDIIQRAHDNGIALQGNFICGLDCDGPESFELIFDCYQKTKIDSFMLNVLVPYPNTALRQRLQSEGRILDNNWEHYDNRHVVYQPKQLTIDQLVNGYVELTRSIYNAGQVLTDSLGILKNNGATMGAAFAIGHKLSFLYDTLRKERAFRAMKQ